MPRIPSVVALVTSLARAAGSATSCRAFTSTVSVRRGPRSLCRHQQQRQQPLSSQRYASSTTAAPSTPSPAFFDATPSSSPADDAAAIPAGATQKCHQLFTTLTDALNRSIARPESLRLLSYTVTSPADADLFRQALKRWRMAKMQQDTTDNLLFLDTLVRVRAWEPLLEMLCDRPAYRVLPARDHVEALVEGLRVDVKPEDLETLDKVFKGFAVSLYFDIVPGENLYASVVLACLECGGEEGSRRALVTVKEMRSIGVEVRSDVIAALEKAGVQA
ncbi:hypothetical protein HKX48_008192 [Thoreauomyces humboldtii]|nr:hypothetical protein HKX48_008192 [Thoreauomyces humboldtii]